MLNRNEANELKSMLEKLVGGDELIIADFFTVGISPKGIVLKWNPRLAELYNSTDEILTETEKIQIRDMVERIAENSADRVIEKMISLQNPKVF